MRSMQLALSSWTSYAHLSNYFLPSFVLKQKKQKFKALTSYATNYQLRLNHLNSLCSNSK
jgi:3-methyladenine DNA glycosylase AlkC